MSVEDPFFVVQKEVNRSVKNCWKLQQHWLSLLNEEYTTNHDDYDRISNELKNNLRSIEWDLQDLEETIGIIQLHSRKFNVSEDEINKRKSFIGNTRSCINGIKQQLNDPSNQAKADRIMKQSLLGNGANVHKSHSYSKLHVENETSREPFLEEQQQAQTFIIAKHDEQLELVSNQVNVLKNMSESISTELANQAITLDELDVAVEKNQSKIDLLLRKFPKLAQLSTERRQWCAVGVLGSSIFVVCLLLII